MFYGYDQGVMSQVNLNPDYQQLMGIAPIEGILRVYNLLVINASDAIKGTLGTSRRWVALSLSTTEEP